MKANLEKSIVIITTMMFLTLALASIPINAAAVPPDPVEEWTAFYNGPLSGDDYARDVAVDALGNVYVTGRSWGVGTERDIATVKYDANGNELWAVRYDGPGSGRDEGDMIALGPDGNVYIAFTCFGGFSTYADALVLKYDTSGNLLWEFRYDGNFDNDYFNGMAFDFAGNVYVTGQSAGFGGHFDAITLKIDSSGSKVWEDRYDGPGHHFDSGRDIILDSAGNVYITGHSNNAVWSDSDCFTIKYDPAGNRIWLNRYDGPLHFDDYGWTIGLDSFENVYVAGSSYGIGTAFDYTTISYDPDGNERWVSRYDGPGNDRDQLYRLTLDSTDNVFVTGRSMDAGLVYDYCTVGYDSNGNELWVARYDGPVNGRDEAYSIITDPLGNVYVSGYSTGGSGNYDSLVVAYDPSGVQTWAKRYNGPGNGDDVGFTLAYDAPGTLIVTGRTQIDPTDYDYLTIKYTLPVTAQAAAQVLVSEVESLDLSSGTETSLTSKLDNAIDSFNDGKDTAGINQVGSFQNQVDALSGNKLTEPEADALIADAQWIIDNV